MRLMSDDSSSPRSRNWRSGVVGRKVQRGSGGSGSRISLRKQRIYDTIIMPGEKAVRSSLREPQYLGASTTQRTEMACTAAMDWDAFGMTPSRVPAASSSTETACVRACTAVANDKDARARDVERMQNRTRARLDRVLRGEKMYPPNARIPSSGSACSGD